MIAAPAALKECHLDWVEAPPGCETFSYCKLSLINSSGKASRAVRK